MKTPFSRMMEGCIKGMSEEDRKKMMACGEKMAAMFSGTGMQEVSEEGEKGIRDMMKTCCESKMDLMSACFKQARSRSDQGCCTEKT